MSHREREAEAARNRTARRLMVQANRDAQARGHVVTHGITNEITPKIVCGTGRGLKKKETKMSQELDYANMNPTDAHELVLRLADLLGIPANEATHDAVAAAVDQLFAVMTGTETDRAIDPKIVESSLTASELAACKAEGCDPKTFLQLKRAMSTEAIQVRLRRTDDAVAGIKR